MACGITSITSICPTSLLCSRHSGYWSISVRRRTPEIRRRALPNPSAHDGAPAATPEDETRLSLNDQGVIHLSGHSIARSRSSSFEKGGLPDRPTGVLL